MQVEDKKEVKVETEDEDSDEDSEDEESNDNNEAHAIYTIFTHNRKVWEEFFANYNGIHINGQHTLWITYDQLQEQAFWQLPKWTRWYYNYYEPNACCWYNQPLYSPSNECWACWLD